MLDTTLAGFRWKRCFYLDDSVLFSKNNRHQDKGIKKCLTLLYQPGLSLKLPKFHFFSKKIEYFRHILKIRCFASVFQNVDAIRSAVVSTDITQMGLLLSSCKVYRRSIKYFSKIARALYKYLPKNEELDWSCITLGILNTFYVIFENLLGWPFGSRTDHRWVKPKRLYMHWELSSLISKTAKSDRVRYNPLLKSNAQWGGTELLGNRLWVPCRGMAYPGTAPFYQRDII